MGLWPFGRDPADVEIASRVITAEAGDGASVRRRSSSRMRALTGALVLPVGSSPQAVGASIGVIAAEAAARLLIGFLRIHDLVNVRGVALDEGSQDLRVAVSTILEPPQGEHEASRAAELSRWEAALGAAVLGRLRREACVVSARQMYAALVHIEVPEHLGLEIMEECCAKAFPGEQQRSLMEELGRYEGDGASIAAVLSMRITRILGGGRKPEAMIATLQPLVESGEEDFAVAASLGKHSLGI